MKFVKRYFKKSAVDAKGRLQVIIAQQRSTLNQENILPLLRQDIIDAIAKRMHITVDQVQVDLQCKQKDSVLELNVTLPEKNKHSA